MTRARPGDGLLHPIALLAIATLLVNDHVLQRVAPGLITGKLSDVAGMIFFPLFLQALYEVTVGRRDEPSRRVLCIAIASTAVVFAATKTLPFANDLYRHALGLMQLPFRGSMRPVVLVRDPSDLIAVPFCALALLVRRGDTFEGCAGR